MVQNEISKLAVFLLDRMHHWILLLINYSEKVSEQFNNRTWILASYETYSPQDTASTTTVVEVAVAICLNSLLCGTTTAELLTQLGRFTLWHNGRRTTQLGQFTLWHNGCRATQLGQFTLWHNGRRTKPGLMHAPGVADIFQRQWWTMLKNMKA